MSAWSAWLETSQLDLQEAYDASTAVLEAFGLSQSRFLHECGAKPSATKRFASAIPLSASAIASF